MFNNQYKEIPLKWNVNNTMYRFVTSLRHTYSDQDARAARLNPGIIHFTGDKPWHWGWAPHPLSDEYWKYLKYTEFYSSAETEFALSKLIQAHISRIRSCFP